MDTEPFSRYPKGLLLDLLMDAYSPAPGLAACEKENWRAFDAFVFSHADIMDHCGFVLADHGSPVGFATWDPRNCPDSVRIGHNCIKSADQGRGLGGLQMGTALQRIRLLHPARIVVRTGNTLFFLPARKMYEAAGFTCRGVFRQEHPVVPWVADYTMEV